MRVLSHLIVKSDNNTIDLLRWSGGLMKTLDHYFVLTGADIVRVLVLSKLEDCTKHIYAISNCKIYFH